MRYFKSETYDMDDPSFVTVIDELPLWSAPFGLLLLDAVDYRANMNVLDVGCGTGFPLLELAGRLGDSCRIHGIDPWEAAVDRIDLKVKKLKIRNVEVVHGVAEEMPFEDGCFDLIVSNNGINNVDDPQAVLSECFRVARPGCKLVITVNLSGTMMEFYKEYEKTLKELDKHSEITKMSDHILAHRKPLKTTEKMLEKAGFTGVAVKTDSFKMRFLDGSALMNHPFIKLAFMKPWKAILPEDDVLEVFERLEDNLNELSRKKGELSLSIPMACISSRRE